MWLFKEWKEQGPLQRGDLKPCTQRREDEQKEFSSHSPHGFTPESFVGWGVHMGTPRAGLFQGELVSTEVTLSMEGRNRSISEPTASEVTASVVVQRK